jgi:tetratricopeptide (TPR) repeat protein
MRVSSAVRLSLSIVLAAFSVAARAQDATPVNPNPRGHDSEQWRLIVEHLPDPRFATEETLEQQADILRARRFPLDALDYYNYALTRPGKNQARLLNKLGLTELELRNTLLARSYFQRVVKLNKKDAQAWNNLGAVDYLNGSSSSAISDYKKAIKLDRHEAVFYANLATAMFETKDFRKAQREIAAALELDPEVFERRGASGGVAAHVLSAQDRARFSFEMAKMYARSGMEENMLHALAVACEAGMDIQHEMRADPLLLKLVDDPRVVVMVHNAQALQTTRTSVAVQALPSSTVRE